MNFDVLVNKREFKAYVESEKTIGAFYKIETNDEGHFKCSCKGFKFSKIPSCKHIEAVIEEMGL